MGHLHLKIVTKKTKEILRSPQILMIWLRALKRIKTKENPHNKIETLITEHQVH